MTNPIECIQTKLSSLTDAQRRVADYIMKNPFDAAVNTIDQTASEVHTSMTTIMRLMAVMGYSGYSEFQKSLRLMLREQYNPAVRLETSLKTSSEENLWEQCYSRQINNLNQTFSLISQSTLEQVIEKLADARHIYFAGVRSGMTVARYLNDTFLRMFGKSTLVNGEVVLDWSAILPSIGKEDVVLVVSYPRYASHLLDFVKCLSAKNIPLIIITDSCASPMAKYADILMTCSCETMGFHNSPMAAMMVAECLISVSALRYSEHIKERLNEASGILEELDYFCT